MPGLNGVRRAVGMAGALVLVVGLCSSALVGRPLFEVKPNPPKVGQDVEVSYFGNHDDEVVFKVGDGEAHDAKIRKDKTFTIPKALLKAGKKLRIRDRSRSPRVDASVCFVIEPKS